MVVLAVMLVFFLPQSPVGAPKNVKANVGELHLVFPHSGISGGTRPNGIFIERDPDLVKSAGDADIFSGKVDIEPSVLAKGHQNFKYDAVKEIGGVWYTAVEYAQARDDTAPTGGIGEWFRTNVNEDNEGYWLKDCKWELPIRAAADKYGIRARAMIKKDGRDEKGNLIEWHDPINLCGDEPHPLCPLNGDECQINKDNFVDYYFVILYADNFNYIRCFDDENRTVHNVATSGRNLKINIAANGGAMRIDESFVRTPAGNPYRAGDLIGAQDISWNETTDVSITIELNGRVVSGLPGLSSWHAFVPGGVNVTLPQNLAGGRYLVKVAHAHNPDIVGTFLIDNGNPIAGKSITKTVGIVFLVIGLIVLIGGAGLFISPRLLYSVQERRYKSIDDKIYQKDSRSMRKREKEAKEKKAKEKEEGFKKPTDPSKSFTARIDEYRQKRHLAREAGMTIDEYRAYEEKRKVTDETVRAGLSEVRSGIEKVQISEVQQVKEAAPETVREKGQPEIELLDSVKQDMAFANQQFIDIVKGHDVTPVRDEQSEHPPRYEIPPDIVGADPVSALDPVSAHNPEENPPTEPPDEPPPPPKGGGLLGRISNLTGE